MKKLITAVGAALCMAFGALAANSSISARYNVDENLVATPEYSTAAHNLSEAGWYAGLKLTWTSNKQNSSQTTASVNDNLVGSVVSSFTVGGLSGISYVDKSPSGSGLANTFTSSWGTRYLATTTWYFSVTPETMYECFKAGKDYEVTLTIGDNTYTVTVPKNVELLKDGVKWYPAVGLLGEKVYGDAQLLANAVELANYQDVKFLVDPSGLTFPDGFAAGDETDGEWGVKMLHNHVWTFAVVEGTNLVATCGNANCPYDNGEVRMWLDIGTTEKDYDGVSVTRKAAFDEYFMDVFPEAVTTLTVNGVENGVMNGAGEHTVALSVTGVGGVSEPYVLSTTVTINKKDITGATLVLTPASTTYNAAEQTVTPSVTVGSLAATLEVVEGSTTAATEIGEYSVTVNGTGNFTGTASGTWEIKNTTGAIDGVAATTSETAGTLNGTTLTVNDTTALAYGDGAWTAGLTLTWPMESNSPLVGNGYGHYVKPETMQMSIGETVYTGREIVDSEAVYAEGKLEAEVKNGSYTYYEGLSRRTQNFSYLYSTTWTVAITPAVVEAALAEQNTALEYTMRAGALVWGDDTEGDPDGVEFADYKITLSLENPITFALGENETHDLGGTVLTTTRIKLAPGASVTTTVQQTEGLIFIETPGYDVVCSEEGDVYTYSTQFTHQHAWSFAVVDGTNLVATCANGDCDVGGETKMWLHVDATEKVYDGQSMVRAARDDDYFKQTFPGASAVVTVNGAEGPIKDAGTYNVVMTVIGLGDGETYTVSCNVTVSPVDITDSTLVLAPASTTYNGEEQTVVPSITVNNLTATFDVAEGSVTSATDIGTYDVTVNGTGNFTGTASATWEIKNTTGAMGGVAAASAGYGDVENNILTVVDTTALAYADNCWSAGLVLTWPVDKKDYSGIGQYGHAYYVTEESAKVTMDVGSFVHESATDSYRYNLINNPEFTYLANTTWTVELTPAAVEATLAENKTTLEYAMRAGAIASETYAQGVAFADYKIELSLENPVVFVLGENETHDLGNTLLTTTKIKLAPGASVTTTVQQAEGLIFIETTGYDVTCSVNEGVYTYSTLFTHQHAWSFAVVDGTNLVATCGNDECDLGGETKMWLDVATTEKDYDGEAVVRRAMFGNGFEEQFPNMSTTLTVNEVENGEILDAGAYGVLLSVTGLGDDATYLLSTDVTINRRNIADGTLVLSPASTTYNAAEQSVLASVTVGGLAATIEVDAERSTTAAMEIGRYSVTVNGTGNFTGSLDGTWDILNTTGSMKSVAAASAGVGTVANNTLTVTDTTALAYADGAWSTGLTLTWPMETKNWVLIISPNSYAHYVTEDSVRITKDVGRIEHSTGEGSYTTGLNQTSSFTYLATTTWAVSVTPAAVEAAIAENKSALEYAMRAGAIGWGDATEGNPEGVKFADYKIELSLVDPVTFALGENETHDLGATVLTTTRIKLAPGASVTSANVQPNGAIFTEADGYAVVVSGGDGSYVYECSEVPSDIVDEDSQPAGYMEGETAVVTNTTNAVTIPDGATAAEIVVSSGPATLYHASEGLEIKIYATDENGVRQETEITAAFKVTPTETGKDGNPVYAYTVELDEEKAKPTIAAVDFSAAGESGKDLELTVSAINGLWYGVGESNSVTGSFDVNGDSIVQADGETLDLTVSPESLTGNVKFFCVKAAPSKKALAE